MIFDTLELIKENKVATIKLNRPELLNAVNEQLIWDLQKATDDVRDDQDIKVVIITGAGRAFSAGADLGEGESSWESSKDALMRGYKPIFVNIASMPKPVIASISGPAAGIGAAIAMSCDLRVMADNGYILSVFSNIALVPDGGLSWLLPKFMGYAKAYEYAIEAKKITANECLHYGLANKVVSIDYWDTFSSEAEIQNDLTRSPQNHEAVLAFFEKREPNFD